MSERNGSPDHSPREETAAKKKYDDAFLDYTESQEY